MATFSHVSSTSIIILHFIMVSAAVFSLLDLRVSLIMIPGDCALSAFSVSIINPRLTMISFALISNQPRDFSLSTCTTRASKCSHILYKWFVFRPVRHLMLVSILFIYTCLSASSANLDSTKESEICTCTLCVISQVRFILAPPIELVLCGHYFAAQEPAKITHSSVAQSAESVLGGAF